MSERVSGSYQCGAVRFHVSGRIAGFFLCHCSRCRKDTGSNHAANMFAPQGDLVWESGAEAVRTYRIEGTRHARSFCATCGSAMPRRHGEGVGVVIPAGSLDGPVGLRPLAHIFYASRADWDEHLDAIPFVDTIPTAVLSEMQAKAKPEDAQ